MRNLIEKNMVKINLAIMAAILILIGSQVYLYNKASLSQQRTVSIDINAIITDFIAINKNLNLSEAELNAVVDKFSANLGKFISERAKNEHLIILPKQAVVAGAKDYTHIIKTDVLKGL